MNEWKKLGHPYVEVLQQTYYLSKNVQYTGNKRLPAQPLQSAKTGGNRTTAVAEKRIAQSRKNETTRTTFRKLKAKRRNSFQDIVKRVGTKSDRQLASASLQKTFQQIVVSSPN